MNEPSFGRIVVIVWKVFWAILLIPAVLFALYVFLMWDALITVLALIAITLSWFLVRVRHR